MPQPVPASTRDDARRDESATVGAVARELGVSVRTLHHWDERGVASPTTRTSAGYRAYSAEDVARVRRVVLLRDLGMRLADIPQFMRADATTRRAELERRRRELDAKIRSLSHAADAVGRVLAAEQDGVLLSDEEQAEAFGAGWDPRSPAAARERWGDSAQWAEYAERSAQRTADEWRAVAASLQGVVDDFARAKRAGTSVESAAANELAERHRTAMSQFFHCTRSMQVVLARMFVAEPGMAEFYDRTEPGLAAWMKDAIDANARAHGVDPAAAAWE